MKTILILAGAMTLAPFTLPAAHASGGPYAVDDAGIATPGMRKLESWISFADNGDFISVVSPGITFEALPRIEFELTFERDSRDGDWGTTVAPAVKIALLDADEEGVGVALSMGSGHAGIQRRADTLYAVVPVTVPVTERFNLHLNGGVERDQDEGVTELVWGLAGQYAFDRLELIGEVFGGETGSPGFQTGVRPFLFDTDVALEFAYGNNLDGDRAHWLTVGLSFEF
jgi:hypothetical protein